MREDEAVKLLAEVLHHVVTLGLAVDEKVKASLLMEADDALDLILEEVLVLLLGDLLIAELRARLPDLPGLLQKRR